jgi:hypothetical protein
MYKKIIGVSVFTVMMQVAVLAQSASTKTIEWSFPRPGMETKQLVGQTFYQLGNDFYGMMDELNGMKMAVIILPVDFEALIDLVNAQNKGDIPDKNQLIVAVCVEKAIAAPPKFTNKYIGTSVLNEGARFWAFKTSNGVDVVGFVSTDRKFVKLLQSPAPPTP